MPCRVRRSILHSYSTRRFSIRAFKEIVPQEYNNQIMEKIRREQIFPNLFIKNSMVFKEVIKIDRKHTFITISIITLVIIPLLCLTTIISNHNPPTTQNTKSEVSTKVNDIGQTNIVNNLGININLSTATTTAVSASASVTAVGVDTNTNTNVNVNANANTNAVANIVSTPLANRNSSYVKGSNRKLKDNRKIIYLTFDDGPTSPITDRVLDILKEKNVNATFFVIGNKVKLKASLMKRIHEEGNAIGLHTFTHNYHKIYSSQEAFLCEMDRSAEEIYEVIGVKPDIIRFPTGSSGHLNKVLYQKLKEKHYKIYDWNARITDGVHPQKSPNTFYKEAIKSGEKWNTIFMLMHCDALNANTCKALPQIIDYYKDNNYLFKVIDKNTPEYYFRFEKKKRS